MATDTIDAGPIIDRFFKLYGDLLKHYPDAGARIAGVLFNQAINSATGLDEVRAGISK